ncbi:MAG: beta-lactamase family protein [Myxococcota bacterium]|nr:beta-lactamase family protein [Myxococcota bacterium]
MLRAALILFFVACGSSKPAAPPPPAPTPDAPAPVTKPAAFGGIWLGTLQAGGTALRIQLRLDLAPTPPSCSLDSLDQGAMGIPCDHVVVSANELSFEVPAVQGGVKGTLSADAKTVTATWTQGGASLPIVLTRQTVALEPAKAAVDPAMDPVDIEKIQAVTDADLAKAIAGPFAPSTGVGVTIGIIANGKRKIFSYGAVKPDSVFEIGSITKVFTGLALAQMVEQKKVRFDEPVRALLPAGTVAAPASGGEITLLDLSAQRSGLPRLPDNMKPADLTNPYADYDAKALYTFMGTHGVAMPAKPVFGYSNLGVGLLGQALAARARTTYEAVVRKQITEPLGMRDTAIKLSPALKKRFVAGHGTGNASQRAWDLDALAGAGALRSTAGDMLTFLDAQLHPERVKGRTPEAKTLPAAITASHEIRGEVGPGMHIALNWFRVDETGSYWHNGATGGYSSFAVFNRAKDFAVIVLCNRSIEDGTLADDIGKHIVQRLLGLPAMTVAP